MKKPVSAMAVACLLLALAGGGFWLLQSARRANAPVSANISAPSTSRRVQTWSPAKPRQAVIYTATYAAGSDDNGLAPSTIALADPARPAKSSIEALIAADQSPLPRGTKLNKVAIADGLATVDFSSQFKDNFQGGDTREAQAINSVLRTLGQFSTISTVQITVEGKTIESLGGNFPIDGPLDVIRPDSPKQQAKVGE